MFGKKAAGRKGFGSLMKTAKVAARYAANGLKMPRPKKRKIK